MKVVIIEDEALASERLKKMILGLDNSIEVIAQLESVEESVDWFEKNPHPDLIFLDIHLEDDLSFAIFEKVVVQSAIIFTTAFDEYAIRAFKLKSIDYLLKPIILDELKTALNKFKEMSTNLKQNSDLHLLYEMIVKKNKPYRERFSVNVGQKIKTFTIDEVAYFLSDAGYTNACLTDNRCYCLDLSLDALSQELDPKKFFRINRQMLVAVKAIKEVHVFAKSRLKLDIVPKPNEDTFVSIDKVVPFKRWLEGEID